MRILIQVLIDILLVALLIICFPIWFKRLFKKNPKNISILESLGFKIPNLPKATSHRLLLHAVSVGEVNSLRPLISELQKNHPYIEVVISSTTKTGLIRANELFGKYYTVVKLPIDFSIVCKSFLNKIKPTAVGLIELEIWPNLILECSRKKIPLAIVNGRLSKRSFPKYKVLSFLLKSVFIRILYLIVESLFEFLIKLFLIRL